MPDFYYPGSLRQCIEAHAAANDNPHFQEQAA
jgi:hypothetical protein